MELDPNPGKHRSRHQPIESGTREIGIENVDDSAYFPRRLAIDSGDFANGKKIRHRISLRNRVK
jgi:hypothetical protein